MAWSDVAASGAALALDGAGEFTLTDLIPATTYGLRLLAANGRTLAAQSGIAVQAGLVTAATLTPSLPASLDVRVLDGGNPVPNIWVGLFTADGQFLGRGKSGLDGWVTGAGDGRPVLPAALAGGQVVAVMSVGGLEYQDGTRHPLALAAGLNQLVVPLEPLPRGALTGQVRDTDGQPLSGVVVTPSRALSGRTLGYTAQTDATGVYSLTLPAGSTRIEAADPSGWSVLLNAPVVEVAEGPATPLDLTLDLVGPGEIRLGIYTRYHGESAHAGPIPVDWRVAAHFGARAYVRGSGYQGWKEYPIRIRGVPGDPVQVCVDGVQAGLSAACQDVVLDGQRRATAVFQLEEPSRLTGRVVADATGQPVAWADGSLYAVAADGQRTLVRRITVREGVVNESVPAPGRYALDLVSVGTWLRGQVEANVPLDTALDVGESVLSAGLRRPGSQPNDDCSRPGRSRRRVDPLGRLPQRWRERDS